MFFDAHTNSLGNFTSNTSFQAFFSEFPSEIKKKHLKMKKKVENGSKKVFQPAFGCTQHPKAGQNTQHTSFSFSSYGSIGWAILIWPYRNPQWTIKSFFRKIPDFLSTEFGSLLNLISVQTVILKNSFFNTFKTFQPFHC